MSAHHRAKSPLTISEMCTAADVVPALPLAALVTTLVLASVPLRNGR